MVELGRDHHAVQGTQPPAHVGVQEQSEGDLHDGEQSHVGQVNARGSQEHVDRSEQCTVERMVAQPARPIELPGRVVHGMEPPQERDLVAEPVQPVERAVEQQDGGDPLHGRRKHRDQGPQREPWQPGQAGDADDDADDHRRSRQRRRGDPVRDVGAQVGSAEPLAVPREELLERRHEYEQHHDHHGATTVQGERSGKNGERDQSVPPSPRCRRGGGRAGGWWKRERGCVRSGARSGVHQPTVRLSCQHVVRLLGDHHARPFTRVRHRRSGRRQDWSIPAVPSGPVIRFARVTLALSGTRQWPSALLRTPVARSQIAVTQGVHR